ncbi:SAYSvFN domain-containing protein 1 [Pygocentrus nattereri]|uniref:SAYSvFN domain-containing protein 1 n=1 Tax=Pygocentrus nattereri TaxID=42514 RepID=UPI0008148828|nr:SAYSvFN domain-containing protein 1 [Pygocentrus nattereri]
MEQKLAEFRARKRAEMEAEKSAQDERREQKDPTEPLVEAASAEEAQSKADKLQEKESSEWLLDSALGRWLGVQRLAFTNLTLLKVLLWLVLLGLFSELEFGLPFFLLSLFYWIYEGLRSPTARRPGELSAYSVFNPDCQPILGTLTAEQLEGEMGYRPMANRLRS